MLDRRRLAALAPLAALGVAALWGALFLHQGLLVLEEGQLLTEAEAIRAGRVLYRDIEGFQTPGAWYSVALLFQAFGPSVGATRWLSLAVFAGTAALVYSLCARVASPRHGALAVGFLLAQRAIAFPIGTFFWYTEVALLLALATVSCLLRAEERARAGGGAPWQIGAGVALAGAFLFKQNIGGVLLLGTCLHLAASPRSGGERIRDLVRVLAPAGAVVGTVALAFASAGALGDLWDAVVVTTLTRIQPSWSVSYAGAFAPGAEGFVYLPSLFWEIRFLRADAGWIGALRPGARAVSLLLYGLAPALAFAVIVRVLRERALRPSTSLLGVLALAAFTSAFPRSDFSHVAQVLPGLLPLAMGLAAGSPRPRLWRVGGAAALGLAACLAIALALHLPYDHPLEHPRARVRLSAPAHETITTALAWIDAEVPPQAPLAILPGHPLYWFLTGRPLPTRFGIFAAHNAREEGQRMVRALEEAHVDWVLLFPARAARVPGLDDYAPRLASYLAHRFEIVRGEPDGVRLLRRRGAPLTEAAPLD